MKALGGQPGSTLSGSIQVFSPTGEAMHINLQK